MRIKIKDMGWFVKVITFNWPNGITLAPFGIYIKEDKLWTPRRIRHEVIHWKQQMEMLMLGILLTIPTITGLGIAGIHSWWTLMLFLFPFLLFYIWYLLEWLIKLPFYGKKAYENISFEREAYAFDEVKGYPYMRSKFAWTRYII